jgi:iron complex outermembrane receptor protein
MRGFAAADPARDASSSFAQIDPISRHNDLGVPSFLPGAPSFPRSLRNGWEPRRAAWAAGLLLCSLAAPLSAFAQSPASPNTGATSPPPASKPAATQTIPRVVTTVVVHGEAADDYLPENLTVGTLDGAALKETPISATVVTRELLADQNARVLSDVVKNDASIGEDYAPVGYYGDYEIRGFPIDLATGLQINGMAIAGEQDVPLENKQRVEFLKGIAGVESGVASAGGLIDFETKRPATTEAVDLATDHRGTAYGAVDLGRLFGARQQVGARVNLAGERIASYVNDADGWRAVGAGSADWKLTQKAVLKGDFEYQHKVERSVCGYQLLGGTTVPDLHRAAPNYEQVYPSTMLGEQSWAKPNTFDTFNTGARLDYDLTHGWRAFAAASYSHSLIDDNVVYAYGTPLDANGNVNCPGAPDAPAYFFCPAVPGITEGGDYGIYDYRDPGELRIDAQAEALVTGHLKTGVIMHDVAGGGELFLRSVQQPGAPPANAPDWVTDGAVYNYIGSENIYQPNVFYPGATDANGVRLQAGPRTLWEDNHQLAAVMQDRVHIPGRIQLLIGGREDSLRDHNYSGMNKLGEVDFTDKLLWLPQYAIAFNPANNLTLYGNYSVMLSLGIQAPWWVDDSSQYLDPFFTRQAEVGAKYEPGQRVLLTTAFFHMRAPFFYPKIIQAPDSFCPVGVFQNPADQCFESEGRETHDGVELNAEGKAANWLRLTASAAGILAISSDTGTPSFDNKQVLNVPHLRTALFADMLLPHAHGLHLMPGWSYTGRKEATRDDAVSVPGYNLFNLGARYTPGGEQGRVTLRLYADNIADKRYWKDTGASYGDTFIHLGAPTTVRLSAHYTF